MTIFSGIARCGAAAAVILCLSVPAHGQPAPATYWVCSILVPVSLEPPVAGYIISTLFRDQTTDADVQAVERRHAAAVMDGAKAAGISVASGVPGMEANALCMPLAEEALAQKYRRDLFTTEKADLALRRQPLSWAPPGAEAVPSDPVPPLPPPAKPGRLGVQIEAVGKNIAQNLGVPFDLGFSGAADGALLTDVAAGSVAQRSGLRMMDVVIEIAGRKIETPDDMRGIIAAQRPGTLVPVTIIRFGERKTLDVLVGE